ncbi:IS30 family transposase [Polaromonas sp. SM01]|uniref:IS30 family transposase n=1 Tax=Polaromonas sp. SM01 TaxID=3085630 RepID=UPI0029826A55|nr:IS30 family transposase [Polaromonas sp. SM01]MDW5442275.1 IS30 family transposase [Polaromonas sp. SM01]
MNYKHLTREERYQIHALKRQSVSLGCIAAEQGRNRSTISRELQRNSAATGYKPAQAHDRALERQGERRNARHFSAAQWAHVEALLRLQLSPQQVSGRLRLEKAICISTEAIYQRAYRDKGQGGDLVSYLRCQKVRRKRYASGQERRGVLAHRTGIEQRPAVVDQRSRLGDWEGDTIIGKHHQGVLLTLVERKSRYTLACQLNSRHSAGVTQAVIALLRPHRRRCYTLTFDNGKEFAEHAFIAQCLSAKVYFAHPYCSWERGLNENHNGLLRQYFPKKTSFLKVSQHQVDDAVYRLNHRPRKCLGYRTPHEVFYGLTMQPITLPFVALCT